MDNGLFAASILLAVIAGGVLYFLAKSYLPAMSMPFSELSENGQKRVLKQKFMFRAGALGSFSLAALLLFTGMPRAATILAALAGFIFQYQVFCLRRMYPIRPSPSAPHEPKS